MLDIVFIQIDVQAPGAPSFGFVTFDSEICQLRVTQGFGFFNDYRPHELYVKRQTRMRGGALMPEVLTEMEAIEWPSFNKRFSRIRFQPPSLKYSCLMVLLENYDEKMTGLTAQQ